MPRHAFARRFQNARRRPHCRPGGELLERRLALATVTFGPLTIDVTGAVAKVIDCADDATKAAIPTTVANPARPGRRARVVEVDARAFRDVRSLTSVRIPASIRTIDDGAFEGCVELPRIVLPTGLRTIGANAFKGSGLTSVVIPLTVTRLGVGAFDGCKSLTSIGVHPRNAAFRALDGILYSRKATSLIRVPQGRTAPVTIPSSVNSLASGSFAGCGDVTAVAVPASVAQIGDRVFAGCTRLQTAGLVPGLGTIGQEAFAGCTSLSTVSIPASATTIGSWAFAGCTGLTSLSIPASVTAIGADAFSGCNGLTDLSLADGLKAIGTGMFKGCSKLRSVTVPGSVTTIGDAAFSGCSGMESVALPGDLALLPREAFRDCTSLKAVSIPGSVTTIDSGAFEGCTSLTAISLPDSVATLGARAFGRCATLTEVSIPAGVTSISDDTFKGCSGLAAITVATDNPNYVGIDGILYLKWKTDPSLSISHVPAGKSGAVRIAEGTISLQDDAFEDCDKVTSITLPASLRSIVSQAGLFSGCHALKTIDFCGAPPDVGFWQTEWFPGNPYVDPPIEPFEITTWESTPFISVANGTVRYPASSSTWTADDWNTWSFVEKVAVAAPSAPGSLTVTEAGGSATLAWHAPSETGDAAVTDYLVEASSDGGATWVPVTDAVSATPSATITGLPADTVHAFRVAAVTFAGRGAFSSAASTPPA